MLSTLKDRSCGIFFWSTGNSSNFPRGSVPFWWALRIFLGRNTPPICVFTIGRKGSGYWTELPGFLKFSVCENHLEHLFKILIPGLDLQIL